MVSTHTLLYLYTSSDNIIQQYLWQINSLLAKHNGKVYTWDFALKL